MYMLISPAKSLNEEPMDTSLATQPALLSKSSSIFSRLKRLKSAEIQSIMGVSEKIADLNQQRNQRFSKTLNSENAKPALFTFNGDVYTGLDAESFSEEDLAFAQDHLGILSGLYGLLRPMDLMQAYRLEMGTKIDIRQHSNLYTYWGDSITDLINKRETEHVVNLASNEYFKSVNKKKLKAKLTSVQFKDEKNGKLKVISFFAKKARGMMCKYAIKHQINDPADLVSFSEDGYYYESDLSTDSELVFVR